MSETRRPSSALAVMAEESVLLCLEWLTKGPRPSAAGDRECDNSCRGARFHVGRVEVRWQLEQESPAADTLRSSQRGEK